jgi:hypothetical protein
MKKIKGRIIENKSKWDKDEMMYKNERGEEKDRNKEKLKEWNVGEGKSRVKSKGRKKMKKEEVMF